MNAMVTHQYFSKVGTLRSLLFRPHQLESTRLSPLTAKAFNLERNFSILADARHSRNEPFSKTIKKGSWTFETKCLAAIALVSTVPFVKSLCEESARPPEYIPREPARILYPPVEPYNSGCLQVSETHIIYWEESGNPTGRPVIFLHGGPGGGCSASSRQFFNPSKYRIICMDQRGSGRSSPLGSLVDNTTWHLVADIEKLRKLLQIEKWQVFGGSWGSTLALAYAEMHPEHVLELVLRGIFMLRPEELRWFYQEGASFIFPDAWEDYKEAIPPAERINYLLAYRKRLTSPNDAVRLAAAKAWTKWEMRTCFLVPQSELWERSNNLQWAQAFARIENHFFVHQGWFPHPNYLLDNVDKIRHIPTVIIQGRYDVVCPMLTSWELHRVWPEAKYIVVPNAGHSALESAITSELVHATDKFAECASDAEFPTSL